MGPSSIGGDLRGGEKVFSVNFGAKMEGERGSWSHLRGRDGGRGIRRPFLGLK